ncbi:glycosyltransferase family 4 protein [Algibacter sp.]|nr:glycosyltransferase family 4 protein [Algibacter sp.]
MVAPFVKDVDLSSIDIPYVHDSLKINAIPQIQFTSIKTSIVSLFKLPTILYAIFKAFKRADHIHLRCPGNIGLLGCIVQVFFPKKIKTAKYAGNWNPKAKQPLSYKLQKWILSNTFLTKNMQVLVYGDWENQSKNIKSFFTATYHSSEIEQFVKRDYSGILNFVFIGSLVQGKRPFFAIQIMEALHEKGIECRLDIFGEGVLKGELLDYIHTNQLNSFVKIHGNQSKEVIKSTLKKAHFSILPSKSEGWPKAVAEAMFFGVIPIATKVSCVPKMLDDGNRGVLITSDLNNAVVEIEDALKYKDLKRMSKLASDWSQTFTLEYFESEIKKLLSH